ncbi:unnamed protein product, partial [Prorocentrum cordatum]
MASARAEAQDGAPGGGPPSRAGPARPGGRALLATLGANAALLGLWQLDRRGHFARSVSRALRAHALCSREHLRAGRVHTLLTSTASHQSVAHFGINCYGLVVFGGLAAEKLSDSELFGLFATSGVGASLCHALGHPRSAVLGASGALMGVVAADGLLEPSRRFRMLLPVPGLELTMLQVADLVAAANALGLLLLRAWLPAAHAEFCHADWVRTADSLDAGLDELASRLDRALAAERPVLPSEGCLLQRLFCVIPASGLARTLVCFCVPDRLMALAAILTFALGETERRRRSNLIGENTAWETEGTELETVDVIGQGAFGVVHRVQDKNTGQCRVMKTVMRPQGWDNERMKLEAQILQNLDHPHILRIFQWYEDGDAVNIVMEHCAGGELMQTVRRGKKAGEELPEIWVASAIGQCLEALVYIHSKGVAHKDLKSQNLLLLLPTQTPDGRIFGSMPHVVICDLGIAEVLSSTAFGLGDLRGHKVAGTPATMAPEVWTGNCGPKCDVWSMGCVMFEVFSNKLPFEISGSVQSLAKKGVKRLEIYKAGPNWSGMSASKEAKNCCAQLLTFKESARPSAAEALKHAWFRIREKDIKLSEHEVKMLCEAVNEWPSRSPMQRAMCLKMAVGCTAISKFARIFTTFDKDHNGTLDYSEVVVALHAVGLDKAAAKKCAAALDINGDGSCEYIEFAAACLCLLEEQFDELLRYEFLSLGKRKKNALTTRDMAPLLAELRPICESHGLRLEDIDADGDGSISFAEFCGYFGRTGVKYAQEPERPSLTQKSASRLPMKEHIRLVGNEQVLGHLRKEVERSFEKNSAEFQNYQAHRAKADEDELGVEKRISTASSLPHASTIGGCGAARPEVDGGEVARSTSLKRRRP